MGAVGVLQFEVVAYRLQDEYKVECIYEPISVNTARWVECADTKMLDEFKRKAAENLAIDGWRALNLLGTQSGKPKFNRRALARHCGSGLLESTNHSFKRRG